MGPYDEKCVGEHSLHHHNNAHQQRAIRRRGTSSNVAPFCRGAARGHTRDSVRCHGCSVRLTCLVSTAGVSYSIVASGTHANVWVGREGDVQESTRPRHKESERVTLRTVSVCSSRSAFQQSLSTHAVFGEWLRGAKDQRESQLTRQAVGHPCGRDDRFEERFGLMDSVRLCTP